MLALQAACLDEAPAYRGSVGESPFPFLLHPKWTCNSPSGEGKDPGWLAFSGGELGSEAVSASVNGDESIHTAGGL